MKDQKFGKILGGLCVVLFCWPWAIYGAEPAVTWNYDRIFSEPLETWRFLAVASEEADLPAGDRARLAAVDLPWQLERTRPMGYWLARVTIPERFGERDVLLDVESRGPTRVFVNGKVAGSSDASGPAHLRVSIAKAGDETASFEIVVSCRHGDSPARFERARLIAEPSGFSDFVARRARILGSFPKFAANAAPESWSVKVKGSDEAADPNTKAADWETAGGDFKWTEQYTHCWYRGRLTVPKEISGKTTRGRKLHLRVRFDDLGKVFLDGKELKRGPGTPGADSFEVPSSIQPGEEVFAALRVFNEWGDGRIHWMEWRFADLDGAELGFHQFGTKTQRIERVLAIHDAAKPAWLATLGGALDSLESGLRNVETLPKETREALSVLDKVSAMMATSPIIVLPPYLQDVRPDRAKVMWETSGPIASYVEYGKSALSSKAEDANASATIHEVEITGLEPDTSYRYRIVSGKYASDVFEFHTSPSEKRPFTFLVWGDNRSDPRMCERVCVRMNDADAELVLNVGDVVGRGDHWDEWTRHYLIPIRHWSHKWPSYVSIGNHEYKGFDTQSKTVPAFNQYLAHPTIVPGSNEYWYSFDYSNGHFVLLDGNRFKEVRDGREEKDWTIAPNDPQLAWLEKDLKKAAGTAEWIFVVIHQPPYSEGWAGGYYDGDPSLRNSLVPILERYGVDIVFAGHTHDYERGLPHPPYDPATKTGNNAVYIITGGGGASLDNHKYKEWGQIDLPDHVADATSDKPDAGEYYKYHYCWLRVEGKRLSFEAREVLPDGRDGGVFDRFRLDKGR